MELLIVFIFALIAGLFAGFYFGKMLRDKPLTEEQKARARHEEEERQLNNLFTYSESVATRGYDK